MSIEYKDAVICTGQSNMTILLQALIDAGVDSGVWVSGEAQGGQYLANNTWLSLATPWTRSNYYNQIIAKQGGRKYKRLVSVFWQGESDTDTTALSLAHAAKVEQYHRFLAQDLLEDGGQLFEIIVLPWNTSIGNGTAYTNLRNGLINYVNKSPNTRIYIDSKDWTRYDTVHINSSEHKKYSYLYINAINNFLSRSYSTTGGEHATVQYVKELLNVVGGGNVTAPTSSVTVGSLTVFDSTDGKKIKALANGSNNQVLSILGGLPTWVTLTAGSGDVTGLASSVVTNQLAIYANNNSKQITALTNANSVKWVKVAIGGAVTLEDAATTRSNLGAGDVNGFGSTIVANQLAIYDTNNNAKRISNLTNSSTVKWIKLNTSGDVVLEDQSTTLGSLGFTIVGSNLRALSIPAATSWVSIAPTTGAVTLRTASQTRSDIGAGDVTGTGSSPPIGSIATYSTNTTGKNIGFLSNTGSAKWLKMPTDSSVPVLEDAATTILNLTRVRDEASASITLQNSDNGSIIRTTNTGGAITISIPAGLTGNFSCMIIQGTTQAVTIQAVGGSGVAINSFSNYTKLAGQYATATILEVASNVYILAGNLIA